MARMLAIHNMDNDTGVQVKSEPRELWVSRVRQLAKVWIVLLDSDSDLIMLGPLTLK